MKRFLAAAALAVFSVAAVAQDAATQWQAGKNYFVIDPPLPTQTGDKIEVTEVFSYGCPACNFAHTYVDTLRKHLPANAQMDFVPASFNKAEDWVVFQRAYLTAKALGIAEKTHDAMFDAVWKTGELAIYDASNRIKSPLPTIEDVAKFYAKYGVKADQFVATANSFTINTRMKQADAFVKAAGVDQTPTIVVNGKYRLTTVSAGGSWEKAEQLVLFLVNKESSAK
ncbi:MAG: thiol:disulfide interchange protein DsbA/DsbL [Xanthomonadales bacterium PRO7]|jgi:thiol:disulfide interchange protein DsbA|nr:thiol:disulfide interchange protein DsbA/DsbL [Xanthomonadales bacterium PRO7]HMM56358.1 thiol:disulfide interchange protein DsbA/DsbL [Rudaea sp.]